MFKKVIGLASSLALIVVCLVGCSNSDEFHKDKKVLDKVTIAEFTHSVFYAPQYIAISNGFFEEEGINVDIINTQGSDKAMAALILGEAQIGLMGPEVSIYVYNHENSNYAINFAQLTKKNGNFIIAREKIANFNYSDLKGKEILGGKKGGIPLMTLEYVLKQNDLTIAENHNTADVNVRTDIPFATMAGAFASGEGDFITAFEPTATSIEKAGLGYIVASIGKDSCEIPSTTYCTTKNFMKNNEDFLQKFTNAIYKAQKWCETASSVEIARAIQPFFDDLSLNDLILSIDRYKSIDAWCADPLLKKESLNSLFKVMKEAKELNKVPPYKEIVNTGFANNAIKNIN